MNSPVAKDRSARARQLVVADLPSAAAKGFDFARIAETLCAFIRAAPRDAPFNVCVSGGWGSGKTSLLSTLTEMLRGPGADTANRSDHIAVWFEPWKLTGEIEVRNVLAHRVLELIADDADFVANTKIDVDNKGLLRMLAQRILGVNVDDASRIYRAESATRDTFAEVETLFRRIAEAYLAPGDRNRRIVVLVDDLDRCSPERIVEVLEAVKLFFDLPGMVFVFALDCDQLEGAVAQRYGLSAEQARTYLEKIFQLTVPLPPKGTDALVSFLVEQLGDVGLAPPDDDLSRAVVACFGHNLRNVKLFVNTLSFQRNLIAPAADTDRQPAGCDEELVKWLCLETTTLRKLVATRPDDLVGIVRALELLAHGGFLHDPVQRDRYVRALRSERLGYCALIALALVRLRRANLPAVRLELDQQAIVDAIVEDGDVEAALSVLRAGRLRLADADLPAMMSLARTPMPEPRTPPEAAPDESAEAASLDLGGPLSAREWDRIGTELREGEDHVGAGLCHLMAVLMKPRSVVFLAHLGRTQRYGGAYEDALVTLRTAYGLDPGSTEVVKEAAYLYDFGFADKTTAALLYRKALQMGTRLGSVPSYLSAILSADGDAEGAFLCALDAYLRSPSNAFRGRQLLACASTAGRRLRASTPDGLDAPDVRVALEEYLDIARIDDRYPPRFDVADAQLADELLRPPPASD